jgi:hypothetical protein
MKNARCFSDVVKPKRLIVGASVLAVLVVLGACITTKPVVFDESIPPEETADIFFMFLKPTSYNGIALKKWRQTITNQRIPQGEAVFVVDIDHPYVSGRDFVFAFNFEGGKEYYIIYVESDDVYGVNVYNSHPAFSGYPANPKDTLIAFVPFVNQPDTVTTSY